MANATRSEDPETGPSMELLLGLSVGVPLGAIVCCGLLVYCTGPAEFQRDVLMFLCLPFSCPLWSFQYCRRTYYDCIYASNAYKDERVEQQQSSNNREETMQMQPIPWSSEPRLPNVPDSYPVTNIGRATLLRISDTDTAILSALKASLITNSEWLGKGRDVTPSEEIPETLDYNRLEFVRAWEIEHDLEKSRYEIARKELEQQGSELPGGIHQRQLKTSKWSSAIELSLESKLNECMALHGTSVDVLGQILSSGLNERYSSGAFGSGTYLAEDAGKADQYCKVDFGGTSTLHAALYPEGEAASDVCYLLVCKVLLGESAVTKDGSTKEGGGNLWADTETRRELGQVPDSDPPFAYHSLLVETGQAVKRYREIVMFHSDRVLIKYLIAYRRAS